MSPGELLIYLDTISPFIAILFFMQRIGIVRREKLLFLFLIYLTVQFFLNGAANYLAGQRMNSHPLFHLNILVSFFLVTEFYIDILPERKTVIKYFRIAFLVLSGVYLVAGGSVFRFNSFGFSVATIMIVTLSLFYFLNILRSPLTSRLAVDGVFWFNVGFFTYYSCSFVVFITYGYLTSLGAAVGYLWRFHNIMLTILCIYMIIGMLCYTSARKYQL